MDTPALKATAFQSVAEDLLRLVDQGRLSRPRLEARLEAPDLELLEEKINPTAWIPMDTYRRCVELLVAIEAPGERDAYLVRRGEHAADRLASLGIYSQLDATAAHLGTRIGKMIVTLSGALYNFGSWSFEVGDEEGAFEVVADGVAALPEVGRFSSQGFIQAVASRVAHAPRTVTSERTRPDRVVFRAVPG